MKVARRLNCAAKSVLMCDGKEGVACCTDSLHYPERDALNDFRSREYRLQCLTS